MPLHGLVQVGYLAVTQALHPDHELILLIVNTIQRDLTSDNILTIGAALSAASRLMNQENIPAILPSVIKLLNHSKDFIRKRAVMTIIVRKRERESVCVCMCVVEPARRDEPTSACLRRLFTSAAPTLRRTRFPCCTPKRCWTSRPAS